MIGRRSGVRVPFAIEQAGDCVDLCRRSQCLNGIGPTIGAEGRHRGPVPSSMNPPPRRRSPRSDRELGLALLPDGDSQEGTRLESGEPGPPG